MSKHTATEHEIKNSSYNDEDLHMELAWWEAHEMDNARHIGDILAEDVLKHFDLIDKRAESYPRG